MQEQARALISRKRSVHGADELFILPISTTIDKPRLGSVADGPERSELMTASNLQYEKPEVEIDGIKLKQHPYFRFLFVRKFRDKLTVFNAKTWKWKTSIPLEIVFAFMDTKTEWKLIDREHVYNVKTNELNGKKYRGDEFANYELERFYHPSYANVFVDFIGRAFTVHEEKLIPILDKTHRNVRFYYDGAWLTIPAARFNYECYTHARTKKSIILKDNKLGLDCYRFSNLIPKDEVEIPSNLKIHPKYSDYGYNGEVFSLKTMSPIKGNTISIYLKGKRIYYNRFKFIYECLNNKLLNPDEFVIDNQLCNPTTLSFKFNDKTYYRTSNPSIYVSADDVFYAPWNSVIKPVNGFINIGTRMKPNLIPIPLTDRELHTR